MPNILDKVKTIVLVMFENRSFDHMLGHLSLENINTEVDGLKDPLDDKKYNNIYKGDTYPPYEIEEDIQLPYDLPHENEDVATQLALSDVTGRFTMTGFVKAFADKTGEIPNKDCLPMGFFKSSKVPITSFLARTFCTCDHWFAPLPSSTQPNRTMAFYGDTNIHTTKTRLINMNNSIFDWLTKAGVRWRVYHDGLSFFILYQKLWKYVFTGKFKDYEFLSKDIQQEPAESAPEVIIVEPSYQSSPHIGSDRPNDNHAPLAIGWGEEFLRRTYEAITSNQQKFENTVMIVYYDEHGGFCDHVPPPFIKYTTTEDTPFTFNSCGVRIPAIIVSPLVKTGSVCHSVFDHTSVLQFLAEKFTPGTPYSDSVQNRRDQGIASITEALTNEVSWVPPVPPSAPITVNTALGKTIETAPSDEMTKSFEYAANQLMEQKPAETGKKYPELFQWKNAVENARGKEI